MMSKIQQRTSVFGTGGGGTYLVIFVTDKPDHREVRAAERPGHSGYKRGPAPTARVRVGGPTLPLNTDALNGSLFIVEAEDITAVGAFVVDDPL